MYIFLSHSSADAKIAEKMCSIIEKTEDGNEVIGNGLLAGMPVIKPVDTEVKEEKEDTKSDLFNTEISLTDPLTGPVKEEPNNNDFNSLFAVPTVEDIKPEVEVNTDSLFGTSTTQNEIAANDVVTTNNVQVAVAEVKDVIKGLNKSKIYNYLYLHHLINHLKKLLHMVNNFLDLLRTYLDFFQDHREQL